MDDYMLNNILKFVKHQLLAIHELPLPLVCSITPISAIEKAKLSIKNKKLIQEISIILPKFDIDSQYVGDIQSFGSKNANTVFYVIWLNGCNGFFSIFSMVIGHLKIAQEIGMTPIIDFQYFKNLYNDSTPINSTENMWEYYFKPVSKYTLDEVYDSKYVVFCNGKYPQNFGMSISHIPNLYNNTYLKYIHLQDYITDRVNKVYDSFHGKVIGVHFRGQELKTAPRHPFPPTERQMIFLTNEILHHYDFQYIFLVSEEQRYVDLFIKIFGDKVIINNCYRTYNENAYLLNPRQQHRYLLGLEVLIDATLLAKCNGLLSGSSNVSEYARLVNNGAYEIDYDIFNGLNSKNLIIARYLYNIKKYLPTYFGGLLNEVKKTINIKKENHD
jgi:hypothetical protein